MRLYRYAPAKFYRDHTNVARVISLYVSTSAENGPAMAGPAAPVPAPMNHRICLYKDIREAMESANRQLTRTMMANKLGRSMHEFSSLNLLYHGTHKVLAL